MNLRRISRRLSGLLGGPGEMLCSRAHRNGWRRTEAVLDALAWLLWRESGHCARCWRDDHQPREELPDRLRREGW